MKSYNRQRAKTAKMFAMFVRAKLPKLIVYTAYFVVLIVFGAYYEAALLTPHQEIVVNDYDSRVSSSLVIWFERYFKR